MGKLWFNKKVGLWAALLFQLLPLFFVYGVLMTPDVPLVFFWLLTLYLFSIALHEDQKWAWYFAGAALGLSMLSKYTGVFLVPSAFLFLILHRRYRQWLLRKEPYLALVIALIVFAPVILWNIEHGWTSFVFQVSNRLSEETSHPVRRVVEFLLLQLGATSPMLLVGLLMISAIPVSLSMKDRRKKWRFGFSSQLRSSSSSYFIVVVLRSRPTGRSPGISLSLSPPILPTAIFGSTAEPG